MTGRSATRLIEGLAIPPTAVIAAVDAAVVKNCRRVSTAPLRLKTAMWASAVNYVADRARAV